MIDRPPAQDPLSLDALIAHVVSQHPQGDALERVSDAVATSARLGDVADHLIGHFVDQARACGASWTEIGQHMGVSKQAVQQRFVPKDSDDIDFPTARSLSRFTPRAHRVLQQARTEARELGHDEVTDDHLLLALVGETEGLAACGIVAAGASLDQVRELTIAGLGRARKSRRRPRFGRGSKKTIELALREALRLGHNYIGTEHLLLGLLRNDRERPTKVLIGLGVTHERVEEWLRQELAAIQRARRIG